MIEREQLIIKAIEFWENSDIECCYSDAELANVTELMADFALSVQKEIDLEILRKRVQTFLYLQRGHYSYEVEKHMVLIVNIIFEYLKQQPEFKLSEPPRKEEGE